MRPTTPRLVALLASLALTFGMAWPIAAIDGGEVAPVQAPPVAQDQAINELANTWFVELSSPPRAKGTAPGQLKKEHDAFRAQARQSGLAYDERFSYDALFNGLSITLDDGQLSTLQRIPAVKAIWPVVSFELDPTTEISPELATALTMTGADIAQSELGFTGKGVKVAVMDTGIDYDHPDLGGCFGPGCRVATGWDFVGDAYNADPSSPDYSPIPVPDPDPDDCQGHGTHVSGIVGASGEVTGVAPGVTFGAYRVFGCDGSTTADIMAAAMELALADGMDVLNMSIGSSFEWPQYPTAIAANSLVDRGMIVVASIGNAGANGLFSTGPPGNGEKVIGVAAFDNSHISALTFNVNPSEQQVPYLPLATTQAPPTSGTSPEIAYVGRGCPVESPDVPVADEYLADPDGLVALIDRGDCTFEGKYQRAVDAGAVGVIIANNVTGLFAGGGVTDRGVFGIGISLADGDHIKSQLPGATVTWTDVRVNAVNPTGGLISSFSSYGLAPDLSFKPNIGAPGGLIRSTYPLELGGYQIISGTSMASPHVAGGAALYLEAHPGATQADIKTAFQNSADPKLWSLGPANQLLDHTFRQGAGMLDVDDAILATTNVTPSEIALGEAPSTTTTLTIANDGSEAVTYELSTEAAISTPLASAFAFGFWWEPDQVTFSAPSVTVPAGGSATVNVTIAAGAGIPAPALYGGYLYFTSETETLSVPYAGFKGDYQSIQAVTGAGADLPQVGRLTECGILRGLDCTSGGNWDLLPNGGTFTLDTSGAIPDVPYFLVHLDHQVQSLELSVIDAGTGKPIHPVFNSFVDLELVGRNSTESSFFAFSWDGTRPHSASGRGKTKVVPDGTYLIELKALKALGDPTNPDHWETWTSPAVTIDRP
ncbi:MAG: S8 family serine peptidase [Candidatus Limnocylindria bacterium]